MADIDNKYVSEKMSEDARPAQKVVALEKDEPSVRPIPVASHLDSAEQEALWSRSLEYFQQMNGASGCWGGARLSALRAEAPSLGRAIRFWRMRPALLGWAAV